MSNHEEIVSPLIEAGESREHVAAALVMSGVLLALAADPEIRAMAEANDAERFVEGCKNPAFEMKFAKALLGIRDLATS